MQQSDSQTELAGRQPHRLRLTQARLGRSPTRLPHAHTFPCACHDCSQVVTCAACALTASLAAENLESHLGHISSNGHAAELCSGCASQVAPRAVAVRSVLASRSTDTQLALMCSQSCSLRVRCSAGSQIDLFDGLRGHCGTQRGYWTVTCTGLSCGVTVSSVGHRVIAYMTVLSRVMQNRHKVVHLGVHPVRFMILASLSR